MAIAWVNSVALWGLLLTAIPIAIHLLVRQQTRSLLYPSLRFVRETALAAFRRRAIQDALLLACRLAIVICAVLALAGPIVQTETRTARYADRMSRAIVQLDDVIVDEQLTTGAFRTRIFRRANVADALSDAVRWADAQPPSSREIVLTGAFTRGQIAHSDLALIPKSIAIRFAHSAAAAGPDRFTQRVLTIGERGLVFVSRDVQLGVDATTVTSAGSTPAPDGIVRIVAPPQQQALAEAALHAALTAGLRWPDPQRRVVVTWDGAVAAGMDSNVLAMPAPDPPSSAATAVRNTIEAATRRDAVEPIRIPRADLDAWSRPSAGVSPTTSPADEGDRRWLWALALALLALEHWLRRRPATAAEPSQEQRIA